MNWQDDYFSPENVDEQVDQLLQEGREASSVASIVQDLQDLANDDIPRLARIRERLAMRMTTGEQEKKPGSLRDYQQPGSIEPLTPVQEVRHADSARRWRRATFVFAGLVAVLVLASMLAILTLLKQSPMRHPTPPLQSTTPVTGGISSAYYGSKLYTIYRADTRTGRIVWRFHVPDGTTADPQIQVNNDMVYFVANGKIYALDGTKGKVSWSYDFSQVVPDWMLSQGLMISNNILYEDINNKVYGIDAATGKLVHTSILPLQSFTSDIALDNNVLYARAGYELCAFDLGRGKVLWDKQIVKPADQHTVQIGENGGMKTTNWQVKDGVIAMELSDSSKKNEETKYIAAFDTRTGAQIWQSDETIVSYPQMGILVNGDYTITTAKGVIYYIAPGTHVVHAYDVRAHKALWQVDIGLPIDNELQTDGNVVYVAVYGTNHKVPNSDTDVHTMGIIAIDAGNGTVKWQFPAAREEMQNNVQVYEKPILQGGLVYISVHPNIFRTDMTTYAFTPLGQILWHAILY